jgi:hypothetical protein
MAADSNNIDLQFYDNEDADKLFVLKSGTADSSAPFDLTNVELESQIKDAKGQLVLTLTSAGDDGGIIINDAPNGTFTLHIGRGSIPFQPNRSMRYDLLMHTNGAFRRLWGGAVRVLAGVTQLDD